jgi:MFS family permease
MTAEVEPETLSAAAAGAGIQSTDRRWLALLILCLGDLMIVLDVTIVGVALPSIRGDLGFSEESLAWVVNAYLISFGGFLLLGGRLGDLFGHRRLFLAGVALFTAASAVCGVAGSQGVLIAARAVQGVGGAVVSAVALSLMMTLFTEPAERAKAMGIFGFVASGGGSLGVLLGGVLTDALDWHWIFLVNVPVGVLVVALTLVVIPGAQAASAAQRLDLAGAVTVTASLVTAVYAIVNGNQVGWLAGRTLGLLAASGVLLATFLAIEARVRSPLVPLRLLRRRNIAVSNVVAMLARLADLIDRRPGRVLAGALVITAVAAVFGIHVRERLKPRGFATRLWQRNGTRPDRPHVRDRSREQRPCARAPPRTLRRARRHVVPSNQRSKGDRNEKDRRS